MSLTETIVSAVSIAGCVAIAIVCRGSSQRRRRVLLTIMTADVAPAVFREMTTPDVIPTAVRVIVRNAHRGTVTFVADNEIAAQPYLRALLSRLPQADKASTRILRPLPRGEAGNGS